MKGLGAYFRKKREEQGFSIKEVARRTNIGTRYIEAIENQEFDEFPADVYAKGFIRNYANFLDLDAEALVMEYTLNFEEDEEDTTTADRRSRTVYWLSIATLIAGAVLIVLLRFAWVHPEMTTRPAPVTSPDPGVAPVTNGESSVEVEGAERLELEVVATQKTLIYAEFDGMEKREFVLLPGDRTTWTAEEVIRIRTGNPGGIQLWHEDTRLPSLGRSGQVIDKLIHLDNGTIDIRPVSFSGNDGDGSDT